MTRPLSIVGITELHRIPKTLSGLDIFSKEWFDRHAAPDLVNPVLRKSVEYICSGYQLGDPTDPPLVNGMIVKGLMEQCAKMKAGIWIASDGRMLYSPLPDQP